MSTQRSLLINLTALSVFVFKLLIRGVKSLRYTIDRTYGWMTPAGIRAVVSHRVSVFDDGMAKRRVNNILDDKIEISSAKKHFSELLRADLNLESLLRPHGGDNDTIVAKKRGYSTKLNRKKIAYSDDSTVLDYDTKNEPFRYVEAGECAIPNFANVWNAIVDMRQEKKAPVDEVGAHCLADPTADASVYEYQTLIACMLSSQTKDAITAFAMESLKKHGLTMENISRMSEDQLDSLISKVGFHKTKAKNIKQATEILLKKFDGKVPQTLEELESLPGVGPKIANLVLQVAFKRVHGIAVDLHVHRIANRLGWVDTKTPEETRQKLQSLLPKKLWAEVNHLLVGFGQTICTAAGPGCATCAANKWCPTGQANLAR